MRLGKKRLLQDGGILNVRVKESAGRTMGEHSRTCGSSGNCRLDNRFRRFVNELMGKRGGVGEMGGSAEPKGCQKKLRQRWFSIKYKF